MIELSDRQKEAIRQALNTRQEVSLFHQTWPARNAIEAPTPGFTWAQLERQFSSLAATPQSAAMAQDLVRATRKQSRFKPSEMVLREILCIASVLMDETFLADGSDLGEASMT
ncbi:MAG: hypothetical protein JWP92_3205 [Caulobacter sp.]|nr:hypothetical protein [Caulobacter sp.]